MKTRTITQSLTINATPHAVYEALMDEKQHAAFTSGEARISRKVGGSFTVFDGWATGTNLELVKDRKIVQRWHASDWNEGTESTVTFVCARSGHGTKLSFTHDGIPSSFANDIAKGWNEYYWKPLKAMLEG